MAVGALVPLTSQRPRVISLMEKHENNSSSFRKFTAGFSERSEVLVKKSLGRAMTCLESDQLQRASSWLLFQHTLGLHLFDCESGRSGELPPPTCHPACDWFSFSFPNHVHSV